MSFSLLGLLNAISPKSRKSRRVAVAIAYGSEARQKLDLYAPRAVDGPLPVVVFIYGGSWAEGDRRDYGFVGRFLAALGYLVVVPDYRILPAVEYPAFLADTAAAIGWAIANVARFGGDPARVALAGHSAGAYNAVMTALDPAYGLSGKIRAVIGLSGPYDFFPFDVEITRRTFGAVADPEATQPIHHVTPAAPPMFLGTGDADTLVYPRNTAALARALRAAGVEVEERHYAGAGHPSLLLELGSVLAGKYPVGADLAAFLRRVLVPRP